jgi:hypothetical protein
MTPVLPIVANAKNIALTIPQKRIATIPDRPSPSASMYEKYGNSTTRQHSRFCKLCTDSPAYLKRCDGSRILQSEFIAVYKHQYAGRQVSSNLVSTAA